MATPSPSSTPSTKTTFAYKRETYQAALQSLFSGRPETTESDLSKLFTPTFTQRDNTANRDYAAWIKHIRWLREIMSPGDVNLTVTHFLRDGNQIAERHASTTRKPGGEISAAETFMWVELADDGRIDMIVETVRRE